MPPRDPGAWEHEYPRGKYPAPTITKLKASDVEMMRAADLQPCAQPVEDETQYNDVYYDDGQSPLYYDDGGYAADCATDDLDD